MANCTWCSGPGGVKWSTEIDGKKFVSKQLFCSLRCKSEYDDEYSITWQKSGCFVATAVYGDYDHPIVKDLRVFRNNHLFTSKLGRKFVNVYYAHGPKLAEKIQSQKTITFITRNAFIFPLHFCLNALGLTKTKNR